ncbi:MAG: alcohol dehydrogenase catalytic domain-containing protein, partial [Lachnospiraceae bacterium]|nr:alcohol dehydrogenase catalytic domain-containing protein [Lachnospiraceae bacterium]
KLIVPYSFPLVMGNEFVGIIEKTGSTVKNFSEGDRVYGRMPLKKIGAFAEYAAIDQSAIAKVPEYLSDEEAACVPLTALTALQAFELMHLKKGETALSTIGRKIIRKCFQMLIIFWIPWESVSSLRNLLF